MQSDGRVFWLQKLGSRSNQQNAMIHAARIIMEVHFPASLKVVSLSPPMAFPK